MDKMTKTIAILGGGLNQTSLFQAARSLGYKTLLLDGKENVICKKYADKCIQIDISDPHKVVEALDGMGCEGVVSNTESLMYCLAVVQKELGMIGNPPNAIERLIDKYQFRLLEKEVGIFSPNIKRVLSFHETQEYVNAKEHPLILKPEESSGSRGTYILLNMSDLTEEKFTDCVNNSRNGVGLIEDFINIQEKKAIEAELFILNGEIEYLCCFRTIRDKIYKTLPQCYCSDAELDEKTSSRIFNAINKLIQHIGLLWGEYNVELSFNDDDEIFIIEINARQGGMKLPEFVKKYSGIDMNKLLVSTAVGDLSYANELKKDRRHIDENILHYRVLCKEEGRFDSIAMSDKLKQYLIEEFYYYEAGDYVLPGSHSMASIGVLDFKFPTFHMRKQYEKRLFDEVRTILK